MKTLNGERERLLVHHPVNAQAIGMTGRALTYESDGFFRAYGGWRVVEGVLRLFRNVDGRWDVMLESVGGNALGAIRLLGQERDHVKLIIPPQELQEPAIDWEKINDATKARADRYEKVLREMVGDGQSAQTVCSGPARAVWDTVGKRAEAALNDPD